MDKIMPLGRGGGESPHINGIDLGVQIYLRLCWLLAVRWWATTVREPWG